MTFDQNPYGGYARVDTEPKPDPNAVPDGSSREIIEWAGSDDDRIARALERELERAKPRKTLVDALKKA